MQRPSLPVGTATRYMLCLLLAVGGLMGGCATGLPGGVVAVSPFDIRRYEGKWYEIARLDHRFERGLTDINATYGQDPDGSVRVINRGYDAEDGEWEQAIGHAMFTGSPRTGSLKVSFWGPFYGGYHVVALDPDYRWSMVMGPSRDYFWILARDKTIPAPLREALVNQARQMGVRTDRLIWTPQGRTDG